MPPYSITKVVEEPGLTNGQPDPAIRVEFMVGTDGPFFERWRKAEFTEFAAQLRLTEFATRLERLRS